MATGVVDVGTDHTDQAAGGGSFIRWTYGVAVAVQGSGQLVWLLWVDEAGMGGYSVGSGSVRVQSKLVCLSVGPIFYQKKLKPLYL